MRENNEAVRTQTDERSAAHTTLSKRVKRGQQRNAILLLRLKHVHMYLFL